MFGWVDCSEEERKRTGEVLSLARYPGAIDELGFGVLRDAFADRLFPATSTLHTHARYYYLVAYLMKDIERISRGKPLDVLQEMLREGEIRTARRLSAWADENDPGIAGITGRDALKTGWVKMTPASMDWAAIQSLGLLTEPSLKLRGFLGMVSAMEAAGPSIGRDDSASESPADYRHPSLWDVPFETYRGWSEGDLLSPWLDPIEASDLKHRIEARFPGTAYDALLKAEDPGELKAALQNERGEVSFIKLADSGLLQAINPGLAPLCECAANASAFASMLHIRFNYVLREHAGIESLEGDEATLLWARHYLNAESAYHKRAEKFDVGAAFGLCGVSSARERDRRTFDFLEGALDAYRQSDLKRLDQMICDREVSLKGEPRSKIANAGDYASEWFGGIELTYRLGVALMVAGEIRAALDEGGCI